MSNTEPHDATDDMTDAELDRLIEEARARYRREHARPIRVEVVPGPKL